MKFNFKNHVKKMSNKDIIHYHNQFKKEKAGYGSTRYIQSKDFFGRSGVKAINDEFMKRKAEGKISKLAGTGKKYRKPRGYGGYNLGGWYSDFL